MDMNRLQSDFCAFPASRLPGFPTPRHPGTPAFRHPASPAEGARNFPLEAVQ